VTRCFNIAGPCFSQEHYMVPPERRAVEARALIAQGRWFSLVAGRQTGKTTTLQTLAHQLNMAVGHHALWIDLQSVRVEVELTAVMQSVFDRLREVLTREGSVHLVPNEATVTAWLATPSTALEHYLSSICEASDRPVVIFFDEADVLRGRAMVSFLTQLRALDLSRHARAAPWCVVLADVRAVRDYVADDERSAMPWLGTASPFNVTVENVGLAAFTETEVRELTAQHTAETGQRFEVEAIARVYELTRGHPWLVNALCDQCTRRDVTDLSVAITAAHVEAAKETIIVERRTHIDSLLAKLREERVRRVLDPMLAGLLAPHDLLDDDVAYVVGLGLYVTKTDCGSRPM
jgi:hypothetical protein